jgi:hypothetical protein
VLHGSACVALHYSIFLVHQLEKMLGIEENFLKFQSGSIIGAIEDDIILDDRTGWMHEVVGEIILTQRRNGQHYLGIGSTLMRYECYWGTR